MRFGFLTSSVHSHYRYRVFLSLAVSAHAYTATHKHDTALPVPEMNFCRRLMHSRLLQKCCETLRQSVRYCQVNQASESRKFFVHVLKKKLLRILSYFDSRISSSCRKKCTTMKLQENNTLYANQYTGMFVSSFYKVEFAIFLTSHSLFCSSKHVIRMHGVRCFA